MAFFKRIRDISEGTSRVVIDSIVEKQHENGKVYFIITVIRKSDRARRGFWIVEDSYLIEKIINIFFKGDEREEFDTNYFIGKEIIIDVKESGSGYLNIIDIKPVDKFESQDNEVDDEYEEESNLEDELFKEDNHYFEEDDYDFDLDDDFDVDDEDLPSSRLGNGGRR